MGHNGNGYRNHMQSYRRQKIRERDDFSDWKKQYTARMNSVVSAGITGDKLPKRVYDEAIKQSIKKPSKFVRWLMAILQILSINRKK